MDIEKLIAEITDEIYNKVSSDVSHTAETCSSPAVNLAKYIDHTLLKADAREQQIVKLSERSPVKIRHKYKSC